MVGNAELDNLDNRLSVPSQQAHDDDRRPGAAQLAPKNRTRNLVDVGSTDNNVLDKEPPASTIDLARQMGHQLEVPDVSLVSSTSDDQNDDGDNQQPPDRYQVFVDENETDGLPALDNQVQVDYEARARQLLETYSVTGALDLKRSNRVIIKRTRPKTKQTRDDDANPAASVDTMSANSALDSGAGVLAALMALNHMQQGQDIGLTTVSPAASGSTTPSSAVSPVSSDDEGDNEERHKAIFIARYRRKKAARQALHSTGTVIADAGRYIASSATTLADRPFRKSNSSTTLSSLHRDGSGEADVTTPPSKRSLLPRSRSSATLTRDHHSTPTSPIAKSFSSSSLQRFFHSSNRASSPSPPSSPGLLRPRPHSPSPDRGTSKTVKRLAGQLGLEIDSNRTEATQSDAISINNLASVAEPVLNQLAPRAKAGSQLLRYKASSANASRQSLDSHRSNEDSPVVAHSWRSVNSVASSPSLAPIIVDKGDSQVTTPAGLRPTLVKSESQIEAAEADEDPQSLPLTMPSRRKKAQGLRLQLNSRSASPTLRSASSLSPPLSRNMSPFRLESPRKDYFGQKTDVYSEEENQAWEREKRRMRQAQERKLRHQVHITRHVAAVLSRQDFILKLGRALMMFGAPTHRLEAQLQATAKVLDLQMQCIYLPNALLISFGDDMTHTSELRVMKQAQGLDLDKIRDTFKIYNKVVRDKVGVDEASSQLDQLFTAPPKYRLWQHLVIGGVASAAIMPSAFYGSFVDCLAAMPLGALLVLVQVVASRNDLYSSLFEIVIACINAILAGALARSRILCFSSIASGSVVLILPGFIVLSGSLVIRLSRLTDTFIKGAYDFTCSALRVDAPWYRATIPQWYYFLTIPLFLLMLALRNGQALYHRETAFVIMLVGIFVQLPSGLANGGLLRFASDSSGGWSQAYTTAFSAAQSLVEVAVGLTVGLFVATALANLVGGGRRRGAHLSSL
ncbi:pheromone-regulated protein prm10 [Microbotryomycetes sp. JL221]|nr:pheromone-regulated protein prm10 [Microbotryomycetes sp. JL221]